MTYSKRQLLKGNMTFNPKAYDDIVFAIRSEDNVLMADLGPCTSLVHLFIQLLFH